jgi:hypothetical protein
MVHGIGRSDADHELLSVVWIGSDVLVSRLGKAIWSPSVCDYAGRFSVW